MPTEYQLLPLNGNNPNHSDSDEGSTIIPMVTRGALAIPRSSTSRQEFRAPIPWYLDTCRLTKIVIFIVISSWVILVIWQVLRLETSQPITYEEE